MTGLILLVTSCKTTQVVTEYVYKVPQVVWPDFPSVDSAVYDDENDTVVVSGDFWMQLAEYKRDVDRIKKIYQRLGEIEE